MILDACVQVLEHKNRFGARSSPARGSPEAEDFMTVVCPWPKAMIELTRTHDPVLLSLIELRLAEAGIAAFVFDAHTSKAYAGALDTVPSRVMIDESDLTRALPILAEVQRVAEQR